MFHRSIPPRVSAVAATLAAGILLAACNSKPGTEDISKGLVAAYQCGPFVVKEVKKTNGAEGANNHYEVAYAFNFEVTGSQQDVQELLSSGSASIQLARECGRGVADLHFQLGRVMVHSGRLPNGLKLVGVGKMKRTESGWMFYEMDTPEIVDAIFDNSSAQAGR